MKTKPTVMTAQRSMKNLRESAKLSAKKQNVLWTLTKKTPLFLRRAKMDGKKRATKKNSKGEIVDVPQKVNRVSRRHPLRLLLSAAAASVAETLADDSSKMHTDTSGETIHTALPNLSAAAESLLEHALVSYTQSIFSRALAITKHVKKHAKVTGGSVRAAAEIVNGEMESSLSMAGGTLGVVYDVVNNTKLNNKKLKAQTNKQKEKKEKKEAEKESTPEILVD